MKNTTGNFSSAQSLSYWMESVPQVSFNALCKDMETDVVIVGGGIAGLSVAYCLVVSGKKVVVVEDGNIGSGETGRTSAHLVNALDDRFYVLENIFGTEQTKLLAQSHTAAIDFIENTCRFEKIDCDFERVEGYLFPDAGEHSNVMYKELEAARRAGLDVSLLTDIPGMRNAPGPCIRFPGQAQFHPIKYLQGLSKAIIARGGIIYTQTHAQEIMSDGIISSDGYRVTAQKVVVATNSPVQNRTAIHLKQNAYRTYLIGARIPRYSVKKALWWDTGNKAKNRETPPYHYVRIQSLDDKYDLLLCGGEDHATGIGKGMENEDARYQALEQWMRQYFHAGEVIYKWSGQVMEPLDSAAFIGKNPWEKSVYMVTGDSGNGLTHGTIAGILITDLINGVKNPWEKIYKPSRFNFLSVTKAFFTETVSGLITHIREKEKTGSLEETFIERDNARIIEMQGKKYGAYRDEQDQLHIVTAECTHLNCIVKWNQTEKSWDCPCHGSRFSYDGDLLNGPANTSLPNYIDSSIYHKNHHHEKR